ncbi:type VI secretion system lysozyme [Caballeronia mineralivorans PML1(12)]|uniref:Type VI secretion system lysozyme n=1 Tax=Caballeronia mineralivorans PML1(12) TaxID=908627 RepID=A0A0J1CTX5_9BURK|nr:type VI secretion system baseplate subunit TssE [Caballeronia mineralivorans]KLU24052.1 type VI secretion system lysozyme [Caballeronia mineralivorans PML1(12)]
MSAIANGYPLPLFERLVENADASMLGEDALRQSVARELSRLLNARSRLAMEAFLQSEGTVIDYGVPDFSERSLRSGPDRDAIADAIRHAIKLFEPRLVNVTVEFAFPPGREQHAILAIDGDMRQGKSVEHVFFELATSGSGTVETRPLELD